MPDAASLRHEFLVSTGRKVQHIRSFDQHIGSSTLTNIKSCQRYEIILFNQSRLYPRVVDHKDSNSFRIINFSLFKIILQSRYSEKIDDICNSFTINSKTSSSSSLFNDESA